MKSLSTGTLDGQRLVKETEQNATFFDATDENLCLVYDTNI